MDLCPRCFAASSDPDRRNPFAPDCPHAWHATGAWWEQNGYYAGREIGGGLWICLAQMITTRRVMICTPGSVLDFFCYPNELGYAHAFEAYQKWDGTGDPIDGWVKMFSPTSGVRRRSRDTGVETIGE